MTWVTWSGWTRLRRGSHPARPTPHRQRLSRVGIPDCIQQGKNMAQAILTAAAAASPGEKQGRLRQDELTDLRSRFDH